MESYLYINTSISLIVLAFIKYEKGSNNANYYLSLAAIIAWFLPYTIIAEFIPSNVLVDPIIISISHVSAITSTVSHLSNQPILEYWLIAGFWALISIGFLLFLLRFNNSIKWKKKIMADPSLSYMSQLSKVHNVPIYAIEQVESGFILGVFKPVIVISSRFIASDYLQLIITHERQHLKNHDNFRLFILTLCECLFWWNPIVRKLIVANRFYIEARCDEAASKRYGIKQYINDLSSLILVKNSRDSHHFVCPVISNENSNISRIKLLKEEHTMTIKNKLMYMLVAILTFTLISWNTIATAQHSKSDSINSGAGDKVGAMMHFDAKVTYRVPADNVERVTSSNIIMWTDFNKKAAVNINNEVIFSYKVRDLDGKVAVIEMDIIEIVGEKEQVVAQPKLTVAYTQEAMVEIDNLQLSNHAYSIKFTTFKAKQPAS